MIEKRLLTLEPIKLISYKLAIRDLTSDSGINKLDMHVLLCCEFIHEATKCYATAESLLPLRGRVNVTSVYSSLKVLTEKGYLENTKPGKKFVPGQKGWYLVTTKGKNTIGRFEKLCISFKNQFISRT